MVFLPLSYFCTDLNFTVLAGQEQEVIDASFLIRIRIN